MKHHTRVVSNHKTRLENIQIIKKDEKEHHHYDYHIKSLLLPDGYPDDVSEGYLEFQILDALQGLCSYLRGVLSSQAILQGLLGDTRSSTTTTTTDAILLSATSHYIYRDAVSMIASILFSYNLSNYFADNLRGWRLFADIINDIGLTLEVFAPAAPGGYLGFTVFVLLGSICKSLCGVAAGATRAGITSHFALRSSIICSLAAVEGTQETIVSIIGMVFGLGLVHLTQQQPNVSIVIFAILTIFHMIANYKAMNYLHLRTLNRIRLWILVCNAPNVLNFSQVAAFEPIVPWFSSMNDHVKSISLGRGELLGNEDDEIIFREKYIIRNKQHVMLHESCTEMDVLISMIDVFAQNMNRKFNPEKFANSLLSNGWELSNAKFLYDEGFRYTHLVKKKQKSLKI